MKFKIVFYITTLFFGLSLFSPFNIAWASKSPTKKPSKFQVTLKKGQVLDVLPLKQNPDANPDNIKKYLADTILPRFVELGYVPLINIRVAKNGALQGNYTPDVIVFGAWKNTEKLDAIMKQGMKEFPDMHDLRRNIWTVFYNTHYKLKEDVSFDLNPSRFYVATSYWKKSPDAWNTMVADVIKNVGKHDGKVLLTLTEGESPYGYYYNPDGFFITEWENKTAFLTFMDAFQSTEREQLKHINQFELTIK